LLLCAALLAGPVRADSLVWSNSLEQARAAAISQAKLILLFAGRQGCDICAYMKSEVCEAANVRAIIDEAYVPWYASIDTDSDCLPYKTNGTFTLPLVCMIDPLTTNAWLGRTTGPYTADAFADNLKSAARLHPPRPDNLFDRLAIEDSQYQVTGRIWSVARPTSVYYRVAPGTNAANAFASASGTTNWTASLAPHIVPGVSNQYTFDVYATFPGGLTSMTNRILFSYRPFVPLLEPSIHRFSLYKGLARLTLTNLTAGVTNRIERALALQPTNEWITVTNLVSAGPQASFSEAVDVSWTGAFYRVVAVR